MCDVILNVFMGILYISLLWFGNLVCKWIFSFYKISKLVPQEVVVSSVDNSSIAVIPEAPKDLENNAGRIIGLFERMIIGISILLKGWPIIAGLVALKSIARYKELDNQINAEYFLVGSMISFLWAFFVTFIFIYLSSILKENEILLVSFIDFINEYSK